MKVFTVCRFEKHKILKKSNKIGKYKTFEPDRNIFLNARNLTEQIKNFSFFLTAVLFYFKYSSFV